MELPPHMPDERRRGRGAATNPASRYDHEVAEPVDDGWERDDEPAPLRTEVEIDASRTILTRNASPDVPFDRSINPYRGCEHGCVYCFARPTHAHLGLSPGLDFETRLLVKPAAAALLRKTLARPGYVVRPIAMGTNTDPWQPVEKTWRVTRQVLEVLAEHRHPLMITTKGALVTRDIDILAAMAADGLVRVTVSLTTLDNRLSRAMEPRAASPGRRLAMVRALAGAGIPTGVNIAPVVPALTDHEIEHLLEAAAGAGASSATWILLRLPLEVAPLFRDWLAREFPDRAARVMGRVRDMHGGQDYDPGWHRRQKGGGAHSARIARRFTVAARRFGLDRRPAALRCDLFRVPAGPGEQLRLDL